MPTYDYRCTECGTEIEVIHGIYAEGPAECDVCGGAMRKALSTPAIHFKGSGWAKKDAQAASKKAKSSKDSSDKTSSTKEPAEAAPSPEKKPAGSASDAGSTDSKPAAPSKTSD